MRRGITKHDIIRDLKKIGIKSRDKIIVHSSLKSIGWVDGGADTVIDALMEVIGDEGIIMMPTFTYSYESRPGALPYHRMKTPSLTGYVTDIFWKRKNVQRSMHPTHSVAVWGKNACDYIRGHDATVSPFDRDTPIYRLAASGGYILLVGVGHESNSTIHVAEFIAALPFIDIPNRESYGNNYIIELDDGRIERVPLSQKLSGCSLGFDKVERIEKIRELQKEGLIGHAYSRLIKAWELMEVLMPVLKDYPGFLLCENEHCEGCAKRRHRLEILRMGSMAGNV